MSGTSLTFERILTLLRETPTRIAALTADLSAETLQMKPSAQEWSANDVLAHLRACADVWGTCITTILAEERPAWRAINPRTWMKQTDYPDLQFPPSLRAFATQRANLLAALEALPGEDWLRAATVTGAGKVLAPTILSYAERIVVHERPHVRQIGRILEALHR